ncbi:MAG: DegV family protein, partial [Lachnospiraceae bacterium]|nr:DegV family protein [Lachnospiraceae bacterium]
SYKIVVDSCCELPENYKNDSRFKIVPLGLEVGDYIIQDDENFNQKEFLRKVADYPLCPKSSCPSPEKYREAYHDEAEEIYAVTLSSHLSGSYNSAELGRSLYVEKYGEKKIHVVDSESASCGETQLVEKIIACKEAGLDFGETVKAVETFKRQMRTYFVLDNLETLRKNGRLSSVKALVASTLNIKPVMVGNWGVIEQKGQAIGINKALAKMADCIVGDVEKPEERTLMITHCNCPERAEFMRGLMEKRASYRNVLIMDTAGVSSMYANDGGVIVTL